MTFTEGKVTIEKIFESDSGDMKIQRFECALSHASDSASERKEFIKASLAGAAGLDYAKTKDYPRVT